MKVSNFTLSFLLALLISACSNSSSTQAPTALSTGQLKVSNQLVSQQQLQPVSIAIAVVNDITGSYRVNPESLNFNMLYEAMPSCSGRVVLGYTHIEEDSYTPILRYTHISRLKTETSKEEKEKKNPWIESEKQATDNSVLLHTNIVIDSLNHVSCVAFSNKVAEKLNRTVAGKSDVVFALKRTSTFLNEYPGCQRILVVCSDFADTYGRSMTLDPSITLYIIGSNVYPKHVKAAIGVESGYRLFESYEEAFNQIVQQFMYNL